MDGGGVWGGRAQDQETRRCAARMCVCIYTCAQPHPHTHSALPVHGHTPDLMGIPFSNPAGVLQSRVPRPLCSSRDHTIKQNQLPAQPTDATAFFPISFCVQSQEDNISVPWRKDAETVALWRLRGPEPL